MNSIAFDVDDRGGLVNLEFEDLPVKKFVQEVARYRYCIDCDVLLFRRGFGKESSV